MLKTFAIGMTLLTASASAAITLPGAGQTLNCTGVFNGDTGPASFEVMPAGFSVPLHRPLYVLSIDPRKVPMEVKSESDSQVVLHGQQWQDPTMSFEDYFTLNADGTGQADYGLGGWNPEPTIILVKSCVLQ